HLAALAKQRIRFVKQQHRAAGLSGIKDGAQVLLGFSDVFGNNLAEVDAIEIKLQIVREYFRRQGFPRPAGSGEERANTESTRRSRGETPGVVNLQTLTNLRGDLAERLCLLRRQHQIVPGRPCLNA